jgi:hypothetical protein
MAETFLTLQEHTKDNVFWRVQCPILFIFRLDLMLRTSRGAGCAQHGLLCSEGGVSDGAGCVGAATDEGIVCGPLLFGVFGVEVLGGD